MTKHFNHDKLCDYCKEHGKQTDDTFKGCKHYRGGKTSRKKSR